MGLFSSRKTAARPGCDCLLCRHDPDLSAADRKGVEDVREHRVHVVWVSDRADCDCGHEHEQTDEPDFAYTAGLWHHRGHPDLLISGIPRAEVMHSALNDLARRVVEEGERLEPGRTYEEVLGGVSVTVEEATGLGREQAAWSSWFHRRDVPVLLVVWPDLDGVFAWQGADPVLDELQPPAWRVPGPRAGALAAQPSWPFPVPRDTLAIACRHVADGELPITWVQRDTDERRGEDWCLGCGAEHETSELVTWHLHHAVARCPSLREVADLPLDHAAERADGVSPWTRLPL